MIFDISREPPTAQEIRAAQEELTHQKKRQVTYSILSDSLHGVIFLCLYLTDALSGYGFLTAALLATCVAVLLAMLTGRALKLSDYFSICFIAPVTGVAVAFILLRLMNESLLGSLVSGILSITIVLVGVIIGRRLKRIMFDLEAITTIAEDDFAKQQLGLLCQRFPELESYRQQAAQLLRPYLTYGELEAMQLWATDRAYQEAAS